MNIKKLISRYPLDRELLESAALKEVCACLYYELQDWMTITSDQELIDIINHNYDCETCGRKARVEGGSNA